MTQRRRAELRDGERYCEEEWKRKVREERELLEKEEMERVERIVGERGDQSGENESGILGMRGLACERAAMRYVDDSTNS